MITVIKSPNADSRSAEDLTVESLEASTKNHISDVQQGLMLFANMLMDAGWAHDFTKRAYMEEFFEALTSGNVKDSQWYKMHISRERHHLLSKAPEDVNLVDVFEHLVDCTMAGLARSGEVYDVDLPPELLQKACKNTVELLKSKVEVLTPEQAAERGLTEEEEETE